MHKLLLVAVLLGSSVSADAAERVRNGQFDAGNSGFTTSLRYLSPNANSMNVSGTYTISDHPHFLAAAFPVVTDRAYGHDSGMGKYFIANGPLKKNQVVWQETGLKFVSGQEYVFDDWFLTLSNASQPVFEVYYNLSDGQGDQFLGRWHAENALGIWQGMEARFVPTGKNLTITIYDLTGANVGNNFALDAVRLLTPAEWAKGQPRGIILQSAAIAGVAEPATWGMIVAGFGAVGLGLRRGQRLARQ